MIEYYPDDARQYNQYEEEAPPAQQQKTRWSHHLENDPYGGRVGEWAKRFYDNPNIDPGAAIQSELSAFRQRYGGDAPEDDLSALELIASGQAPARKNQTPTEQWNKAGAGGARPAFGDDLLAELMRRAKQGTAIGRDNPNVRAQVDPAVAQMERASRTYIDEAAEGARGRPMNLEGERRMAAERLGQQAGGLESEVIGREIGARRDEIAQALALWGGMMSNEQRMGLEWELAQLNDRARTADREAARDQFLRELALREWGMRDDSSRRWAGF